MGDNSTSNEQAQSVIPTDLLNPALRRAAAEEFGPDGAWLLLSILYYSWRVHYDLARSVLGGPEPTPSAPSTPESQGVEFGVARHLHILGLTYASAELLATLINAARSHKSGTTEFIDTYAAASNLTSLLPDLLTLDMAELRQLIGTEEQIDRALAALREERARGHRGDGPISLDPRFTPVTEIKGGLIIPKSVLDGGALEVMREEAVGLAPQVLKNVSEMQQLVDTPTQPAGLPRRPQSLRSIDNSFRHGVRVLYHSTVPDARNFKYVGSEEVPDSPNQVTIYTPSKKDDEIEFGGVTCEPDDTVVLLASLEQLCVRTGQVARALVGAQCEGFDGLLLAASSLRLSEDVETGATT